MVLLLENNKKYCYKVTANSKEAIDELVDLQYDLSEFNKKNYQRKGPSTAYVSDPELVRSPSYSKYYDLYYIPDPASSEKGLYTDSYKVKREVYMSYYQTVLKLISSILYNDPKVVDLTGIIGSYSSIDNLIEKRNKLKEKVISLSSLSEEEKTALKRKYNEYSYIVKCLSCVHLEKTNHRVKDKQKIKEYQAA